MSALRLTLVASSLTWIVQQSSCRPVHTLAKESLRRQKRNDKGVVKRLDDALEYLASYVYTDDDSDHLSSMQPTNAIREFQLQYGLNVTGQLDQSTLDIMNHDRCGEKDRAPALRRSRRFSITDGTLVCQGGTLSYKIVQFSSKMQQDTQREYIRWAADQWNQYMNLTIVETTDSNADVEIGFFTGDHTSGHDPKEFKPGEYAHANSKLLHLNDENDWNEGKMLRVVALHEFGHVLGLGHSFEKTNVMYPAYVGLIMLSADDAQGLHAYCRAKTNCGPNEMQCKDESQRCIPLNWKCNGNFDCLSKEDEKSCTSTPRQTCASSQRPCPKSNKCIPRKWECDGEPDCPDGEDEEPHLCSATAPPTCHQDQFKCNHGKCIPKKWTCDNEDDCEQGEDESEAVCSHRLVALTCSADQVLCGGTKCIPRKWLCDGEIDCLPNGDDEKNCTQTTLLPHSPAPKAPRLPDNMKLPEPPKVLNYTVPDVLRVMSGGSYSNFSNNTLSQCEDVCTADEHCEGFVFGREFGECLLYDLTPQTAPQKFIPVVNSDLQWYQKNY